MNQRPSISKQPDPQPDALSPDFLDLRRNHAETSVQVSQGRSPRSASQEQTSQGQTVDARMPEITDAKEVSQRLSLLYLK
jgi:hypothetical protein